MEIGVLISSVLFGVLTMQVYVYYKTFPEDEAYIKYLVGFIWLLEFAHSICISVDFYLASIVNYGNPLYLGVISSTLGIALLIALFTAWLVQGFFAQRIRIVSGKGWLAGFCWVLSSVVFAFSVAVATTTFTTPVISDFIPRWWWLVVTLVVLLGLTDVIISAILCWYLAKGRRSAHLRTAAILDKLMLWSIETCLLISVSTITVAITLITMKHNYIWMAILMLIDKLYSNSLLASLNARARLRGGTGHIDLESRSPASRSGQTDSRTNRVGDTIRIDMTKVVDIREDRVDSVDKIREYN